MYFPEISEKEDGFYSCPLVASNSNSNNNDNDDNNKDNKDNNKDNNDNNNNEQAEEATSDPDRRESNLSSGLPFWRSEGGRQRTPEEEKCRKVTLIVIALVIVALGIALLVSSLRKIEETQLGIEYDVYRKELDDAAKSGGLFFGPPGYRVCIWTSFISNERLSEFPHLFCVLFPFPVH